MNLRQNQITVEELLRNPKSKVILEREFPQFMKMPFVQIAGKMTLQQVLSLNKGYVSLNQINRVLKELEAI